MSERAQGGPKANIDVFFNPRSIVVIGVSVKRLNLGQIILMNNATNGFQGRVFGVGKDEGVIGGARVYTSVADLPETPEVAIIITPARSIPAILRQCGEKGIRYAVIESGGFSEYSSDNTSLESEVLAIAGEFGIRILGPNCIGTINTVTKLMMPFAIFRKADIPSGPLSIATQSGGVGDTYIRIANENHIYFNKFVAVGNKLDLDEVDFLEYYLDDPVTGSVFMYLEGFSRGRAFFDAAMRSTKPIVVQKSNRTSMSAKIAQSHTAALSADDKVVSSALHQCGVVRVKGEEELIIAAKVLQLPVMKGKRVAVLSRSGGHAVITVDACAKFGFELVEFPDSFIQKIRTLYDTNVIAHQNPLDLGEIFDYTIFIRILEETLKLDGIDGIIFNHLYQSSYEAEMSRTFLTGVSELVRQYKKPVSVTLISEAEEILDIQKNHTFPTFTTPMQATTALWGSYYYYSRTLFRENRGEPARPDIDMKAVDAVRAKSESEGRIPLTDEALEVCRAVGLAPVTSAVVKDAAAASGLAKELFPAAVKLLSRDASHKTDVGGVRLGVGSPAEAAAAIGEMSAAVSALPAKPSIDGFLVQAMARKGEEFFVGARRDPVFGPVVMAGFGGVFIEVLKDVSIRLAPVAANEAREMLRELTMYPLIRGVRGRPALDEEALVDVICRVSGLIAGVDSIRELDLNPVILHEKGAGVSIVDARVFFI